MRKYFILAGFAVGACGSALAAVPEPVWFHDGVHRYLKLSLEDFGKVHIEVRTVGQPGEASHWMADGEKVDKDVLFARSVGDDEARGTFYIGTGGDGNFKVKLKPGQDKEKAPDEGIVGLYHRINDDRRLYLAKRETEAADKRLAEVEKMAAKNWPVIDKPVLEEVKTRWPSVRDRLLALREKPRPVDAKPRIALGDPNDVPPEKKPDRWFAADELTGTELGFLNTTLDPKIKDGWDGDYNDGFGGSINLALEKDGSHLRFTLNCSRYNDEQTGLMSGTATLVKDSTGMVADFTDQNPEVKESADQARVKLHRIGHYLVVDAVKVGKYTFRGWFDGVYRKQPQGDGQ